MKKKTKMKKKKKSHGYKPRKKKVNVFLIWYPYKRGKAIKK
jgi:hypothetical protein